ncbi:MAG: F0F1 ATP synthase subunit B [Monoglobales bacterium]|jgi:F-type H+-transporting ATPase subunit b
MDFVSIDIWSLIFTWINLIILFFIIRHFLYKPVKNILLQRENEIESTYNLAEKKENTAAMYLDEYKNKLNSAEKKADLILNNAVDAAKKQSYEIINNAKNDAKEQLLRAKEQIKSEKLKAAERVKNEISSISVYIAGKILEREINKKDYENMVNKFINEIGEKI